MENHPNSQGKYWCGNYNRHITKLRSVLENYSCHPEVYQTHHGTNTQSSRVQHIHFPHKYHLQSQRNHFLILTKPLYHRCISPALLHYKLCGWWKHPIHRSFVRIIYGDTFEESCKMYVTGFKFDQNIRDSSGFILFALAPPEVLFASVARCLNRHCARHAAPNRMQWHSWPRILIKWVPDWAIFHVWFIRIRYR